MAGAIALAAGLASLPLVVALLGVTGPFRFRLNLGPGDGPYVKDFARDHEVNDKVGTHWTTYASIVRWPLEVHGPAIDLAFRFARVLPQTAVVKVFFDGKLVDEFSCRGGVFRARRARLPVDGAAVAAVEFLVDSHDRKNLGLNLDWVEIASDQAGRARLVGWAALRPALSVGFLFLLLLLGGWSGRNAGLIAAPFAVAVAWGLARDPWLVYRLMTAVPETLLLLGLPAAVLGRGLAKRGRLPASDLKVLTALGFTALLIRLVATQHPDFYYPDLMTHARLVREIQKTGPEFLLHPSRLVLASGAWTKPAFGGTSGLPYAVGFHALFVPWSLDYDSLLTAEKTVGSVLTIVPLIALWITARSLGLSTLGVALMVLIPTYTSRLSFALLPALTGHAADMLLIAWLASQTQRLSIPRVWLAGVGLVAVCQITYVSSVTNLSLLLACLAALAALDAPSERIRVGARILGLGLAGSALSILLYYRDFLGGTIFLLPRLVGRTRMPSQYPVESWVAFTYERTKDFFGGVYPVLTIAGLALFWTRRRQLGLMGAWLATFLLLCGLRAKIPDVFRYGHETLFVTPLVCLASGEALARLATWSKPGRLLAGGLLVAVAIQGLAAQWTSIVEQLGNAL